MNKAKQKILKKKLKQINNNTLKYKTRKENNSSHTTSGWTENLTNINIP